MTRLGIEDGDEVTLGNTRGQVRLHAKPVPAQRPDTILVKRIWCAVLVG
jgi:anaerobic selenocysteine-containing dehydrogenase